MARHLPKKDAEETSLEEKSEAQEPVPGGALGIVPEAEKTISLAGHNIVGSAARLSDREAPPIRKYRVVGSSGRRDASGNPVVMYEGAQTRTYVGKIYGENEVDIDMLVRQGIKLEEIVADAAVVTAE